MRFHVIARDIQRHDAVGNFCRQMAALLQSRGAEVSLAAENCHPDDRDIIAPLPAALGDIGPADVIFFHFSTEDPALPVVAALPNRKVIYFQNITPERFFLPDDPKRAQNVRQGLAQRAFAARFDVLMANSRVTARVLHDGLLPDDQARIGQSSIVACPPVVGIDRMAGVAAAPVPLPAVDRLVLFVGRLTPHKNVHTLVQGFSVLAASDESVGLAIAGMPTDPVYTRRLIAEVNGLRQDVARRITFLHGVPDGTLRFLFDRASVFASMSAHEGFCVPLVDTMAFGKPLVISAEEGMMETAGRAALVVADPTPTHIANALAGAMNDSAVARRLASARKQRLAQLRALADGNLILNAAEAAANVKGTLRR
jgi:glycosyltransferase involved in cell wall biosynthesis